MSKVLLLIGGGAALAAVVLLSKHASAAPVARPPMTPPRATGSVVTLETFPGVTWAIVSARPDSLNRWLYTVDRLGGIVQRLIDVTDNIIIEPAPQAGDQETPTLPPFPLPTSVPIIPGLGGIPAIPGLGLPPLVIPPGPGFPSVLETGALYTFMVETTNGSQQELIANLGKDGWAVIAIHEVIAASPVTRPPFDFSVDGAIWQGDAAASARLAQDMLAGKFLITTPPTKTTLPKAP